MLKAKKRGWGMARVHVIPTIIIFALLIIYYYVFIINDKKNPENNILIIMMIKRRLKIIRLKHLTLSGVNIFT